MEKINLLEKTSNIEVKNVYRTVNKNKTVLLEIVDEIVEKAISLVDVVKDTHQYKQGGGEISFNRLYLNGKEILGHALVAMVISAMDNSRSHDLVDLHQWIIDHAVDKMTATDISQVAIRVSRVDNTLVMNSDGSLK